MRFEFMAKTVVALIGAIATWGTASVGDGVISPAEWFGLVGVFGTALGVYLVPNKTPDEDES